MVGFLAAGAPRDGGQKKAGIIREKRLNAGKKDGENEGLAVARPSFSPSLQVAGNSEYSGDPLEIEG
jgi:hypothetical protein